MRIIFTKCVRSSNIISSILRQDDGTNVIDFMYDENGSAVGFVHNGNKYIYTKNVQGDVTGIIDYLSMEVIAQYRYDAWGKLLGVTDATGTDVSANANHIANINPLRYRGYYYDVETGLYYLNSRYYDPETGRFINADEQLNQEYGPDGFNVYAYCLDNPIIMADYDGDKPVAIIPVPSIRSKFQSMKNSIKETAKGVLSLGATIFLTYKNMPLANAMYQHGIYGKGKDLSADTYALMKKKLLRSHEFYILMHDLICDLGKEFWATRVIHFTEGDLLYAIKHASVRVYAKRRSVYMEGSVWDIKVDLWDTYDFTELFEWDSLAHSANNLGYYMQKYNMMTVYDWSLTFTTVWRP